MYPVRLVAAGVRRRFIRPLRALPCIENSSGSNEFNKLLTHKPPHIDAINYF